MRLSQRQLRASLRVSFVEEQGVDAGGLVREWLHLASEALFSAALRPQLFSSAEGTAAQSASYHICARDPQRVDAALLRMYQFAGRIIGKALLEQATLPSARLSVPLLKQLLGAPVSVSDLEFVDPELHSNLLWLRRNDGVGDLGLSFSVEVRDPDDGAISTAPLAERRDGGGRRGDPGGVDDSNKERYCQLRLRHRLVDACSAALWHLTKGLHEVIPPRLLCVLDHQELELLLCGVPRIDVAQWREWAEYTGLFEERGVGHPVVAWFWEIVGAMDETEKARLLQFCTGSAALPAAGFRALQSNDGRVRRFQLQGVSPQAHPYPRAHTCFNRLDLPAFARKQDLELFLKCACLMDVTGFSQS